MDFIKEFLQGIRVYRDANKLILKHNMWKYLLFPGITHLLLLIVIIIFAWRVSDGIIQYLLDFLDIESGGIIIQYIQGIFEFLLAAIIRLFIVMIYLSIYKYIVLIILAPAFAYISEITEEKISGRKFPFNLSQFIKDVARGVLLAIRNLIIELIWILGLFVLSFIPVVGLVSPFLLFMVQSYFFGFSMMDYYNERHKLSLKDSISLMRKHKGVAVGVGVVYYLLFLIPFIGWIFSPIYAAISGTIAVHQLNSFRQTTKK